MRRGWSDRIKHEDRAGRGAIDIPQPSAAYDPVSAYILYNYYGERDHLVHQMSRIRAVGGKIMVRCVWSAIREAQLAAAEIAPSDVRYKEVYIPPVEYTCATWLADKILGVE